MNQPTNTIDLRVEQYVALRDKIRELEKAHEELIKPYSKALDDLGALLLSKLQAMGVESARTTAGTVYISAKASASIADVASFWDYVISNEAFDLIDKRANKTAVRDYVEQHKAPPPGVNYSVIHQVGVRRS